MPFAIPSLPSLPSFRSLIDTEPQVLYPASAANTTPVKHLPPVPDDWGRGRGRRASVVTPASGAGQGSAHRPAGRPTHRRTQSAVPTPHTQAALPLGRLVEYSRNPLASTSALSLPTLIENAPISGSPAGGSASAPRSRRTSIMSVPPPPPRPPPTPRAWSTTEVHVRPSRPTVPAADDAVPGDQGKEKDKKKKSNLTRHISYTRGTGTGKGVGTTGAISDVAVLATWSFPSSSSSSSSSVPPSPRGLGLGGVNASLGPPRNINCHHRPSLSSPSLHIPLPSLSSSYSDTLSIGSSASPTSSLNSLPADREAAPTAQGQGQGQGAGRWISWSRRNSLANSDTASASASAKRPPIAISHADADAGQEEDRGNESDSSHEDYIDF